VVLAGCGSGPPESPTPTPAETKGTGSFTVEFARCMRANGVANFPDPDGQPGQLGPTSGVDPASAQYQAAINGPCRSLAPPAWVGDGPANGSPGGQ
jgi:hypothetical protein